MPARPATTTRTAARRRRHAFRRSRCIDPDGWPGRTSDADGAVRLAVGGYTSVRRVCAVGRRSRVRLDPPTRSRVGLTGGRSRRAGDGGRRRPPWVPIGLVVIAVLGTAVVWDRRKPAQSATPSRWSSPTGRRRRPPPKAARRSRPPEHRNSAPRPPGATELSADDTGGVASLATGGAPAAGFLHPPRTGTPRGEGIADDHRQARRRQIATPPTAIVSSQPERARPAIPGSRAPPERSRPPSSRAANVSHPTEHAGATPDAPIRAAPTTLPSPPTTLPVLRRRCAGCGREPAVPARDGLAPLRHADDDSRSSGVAHAQLRFPRRRGRATPTTIASVTTRDPRSTTTLPLRDTRRSARRRPSDALCEDERCRVRPRPFCRSPLPGDRPRALEVAVRAARAAGACCAGAPARGPATGPRRHQKLPAATRRRDHRRTSPDRRARIRVSFLLYSSLKGTPERQRSRSNDQEVSRRSPRRRLRRGGSRSSASLPDRVEVPIPLGALRARGCGASDRADLGWRARARAIRSRPARRWTHVSI